MRDMLARKFERCASHAGFSPYPEDKVFVSDDGLRVPAVLEPNPCGGKRINRRATLEALLNARKAHEGNEKATGASTPVASVTQPD